jgi:hypothetical protein
VVRVTARVRSCGNRDGQSGTGACFIWLLRVPLQSIPPITPHSVSFIIRGRFHSTPKRKHCLGWTNSWCSRQTMLKNSRHVLTALVVFYFTSFIFYFLDTWISSFLWLVNKKLGRTWKKSAVKSFKVLPWCMSIRMEKNLRLVGLQAKDYLLTLFLCSHLFISLFLLILYISFLLPLVILSIFI